MLALAAAAVLVIARSAVFLLWEQSSFDSDQAIFGLMAKHIVEGRALPMFIYGQDYMLGVEAWLAAPLFALFGPSATLLKLPVVLVNVASAVLLVWLLIRDAGLRPIDGTRRVSVLRGGAAGHGQDARRNERRQSRAVSLRVAALDVAPSTDRVRRGVRDWFHAARIHGVRRDRDHRARARSTTGACPSSG